MKYASYFRQRTRIVCTIGPSSRSVRVIERLIRAGMNVARFNLSFDTHDEHRRHIQTVRRLAERLSRPVAILLDLPGPKYRTGTLKNGFVLLKKGDGVTLTIRQIEGDEAVIPVNLPSLPNDVRKGDVILLDDGAMELRVQEISGTEVKCRVIAGGRLTQGRGIAIPGMRVSTPFLTDYLREHIAFAIEQRPDYIALSFVSSPDDVLQVRTVLQSENVKIPIISKIERGQAVVHFDRILTASDSIMVARGDLGVDIPLQKIPLVQKDIIRKCNQAGKPVITATQMLESMINLPRPTRAEVTDVANAIFDGTDAVMLSGETSVGKYPVAAVRMMAQIARETERKLDYEQMLAERSTWLEPHTDELIAYNACHTANTLKATAIVAFTEAGSTAHRVSKYRPRMPILAITPNKAVRGELILCWGVQAFQIPGVSSVDELFARASSLTKDLGLAKPGDIIVITAGIPLGSTGTTNLLKVERVA
ncbi:MAG: pyruvate kinase [Dehalococcoidales bacterium]|nr:pyruvate kinase [Dehalococcoidales bacterium]